MNLYFSVEIRLFSGGCGRLFEGTPDQMHNSLSKLAALPKHTKVFCTHEYTQSNLKFAIEVDPDNMALKKKIESVNLLRKKINRHCRQRLN